MKRELREAIQDLQAAREFQALCRTDPRAHETGAARDAREWIDSASFAVVTAAEYEEDDEDDED